MCARVHVSLYVSVCPCISLRGSGAGASASETHISHIVQVSRDHTASVEAEARRVEAAGGWVGPARDGSLRVAGRIEVPRVFVKAWRARVHTHLHIEYICWAV